MDAIHSMLFLIVMALAWIAYRLGIIAEELGGARRALERVVESHIATTLDD